jgi:hypothetical protein
VTGGAVVERERTGAQGRSAQRREIARVLGVWDGMVARPRTRRKTRRQPAAAAEEQSRAVLALSLVATRSAAASSAATISLFDLRSVILPL